MYKSPDILISTRHGPPLAFVQVKNLPLLSPAQAMELRDTLLEQVARPVRYVMVLSQVRGFIWRRQGAPPAYGEPDVLDMGPILREYLSDGELSRHVRGTELELVFSHWLGDLSRGRVTRPGVTAEDGPFVHFLSDVRGAQINLEAAA